MAAHIHTYAPRITSGSGYLDFNSNGLLPLEVTDAQYSARVKVSTVPLQNGAVIYDVRRAPATISFSGKAYKSNKEDLLTVLDTLHEWLIGGSGTPSRFTFYRYFDQGRGNYRWWRNCACSNLEIHYTSRTVLYVPYSFSIITEDGVEYEEIGASDHNPNIPVKLETLQGPRIVMLDDDAGVSSFVIKNSAGTPVFKVDSAGNVQYTGFFESVVQVT